MSDCRITACANPHAKPKSQTTVKIDDQAKRTKMAEIDDIDQEMTLAEINKTLKIVLERIKTAPQDEVGGER